MSEEANVQAADPKPREVIVDDVAYVVDELPDQVRQLIATYDVWLNDRAVAQKEFTQLDAAVRHLAVQIQTAIRQSVAAEEQAEGQPVAEDQPVEQEAVAALDIPEENDNVDPA